jgi:hypothetical protein
LSSIEVKSYLVTTLLLIAFSSFSYYSKEFALSAPEEEFLSYEESEVFILPFELAKLPLELE